MAILVTIYMVCATRTNAVYVLIFAALIVVFVCLAAAYWRLADGDAIIGNRLIVVCFLFFLFVCPFPLSIPLCLVAYWLIINY